MKEMSAGYERDPTTGFHSRYRALPITEQRMDEKRRYQGALAALWLDIDRFRQVNDSFGHTGGDNFIERIARRIRETMPADCDCIRMGSDEFVVLVPDIDLIRAKSIALGLLAAIDRPLPIDGILIRPSASIGLALCQPDQNASGLLESADRAMLEAKRQGGNRIIVSGNEPLPGRTGVQLAREELEIESALHLALESGGLELHYQPIVSTDGRIEAVEALMRCHALGTPISPVKFIPVAEKTGLIVRLGEWSLLQGAHCASTLRRHGHRTKVAINVSRAQLASGCFLKALHGALICSDVDATAIELELTESLFMDMSPTVQNNLRGARNAGIGLAIDDFGTGFSCLANLKDLPATKLKFDRAFIRVLPEDGRSYSIVKAMTLLAHDLGMTVVAEGVESPEQLEACVAAGVDSTQGFFNAMPMTETDLLNWMLTKK